MPIPSFFKFVDAPLAIVVGGVGAVLITLQLGALGLLVQSQVDRAHERDAGARQERMANARCLGAPGAEAFATCRQSVTAAGAYDTTGESFAIR